MPIRLAIMACGVLVGAFTLSVARDGPAFSATQGTLGGLALLLGACVALTGAAAWNATRRGRRAVAVLLLLAALAWCLAEWGNPAAGSVVFTIGLAFFAATPVLVLHAAAAAAGITTSRSARIVVVSGYVVMLGAVGAASALTFDTDASGCAWCSTNLLDLVHGTDAWTRAGELGVQAGTVWLCAAVLLLGWWFLRARGLQRRDASWFVAAATAYLTVELLRYARSLDSGQFASGADARRLWQLEALCLIAVALAAVGDVLRARRAERALTRVVSELGSADDLTAGLARRVGDPDLHVAYPSGDGDRYLDGSGRPVDLTARPGRTLTAVERSGTTVAVITHRSGISPRRVRELADAVRLALDHERLRVQALAQLDDLRRSGARLVAAGDAERRRLERDLHDGAQQHLVTLLLSLRLARREPGELAEVERLLESSVERLRTVARGLYPVLLERAGLAVALGALAETRPLRIDSLPDGPLPALVESTAYLVVQRASRLAPSSVRIASATGTLEVRVHVDGGVPNLATVTDRVTTLDGTMRVDPSDGMTTVTATLPLPSDLPVADGPA